MKRFATTALILAFLIMVATAAGPGSSAIHALSEPPQAVRSPAVLRVAKDGTGDYSSLSAAVGAAPDGATVHVAPGTYRTSVTIEKPLRIVGAGRGRTTLLPTAVWKGSTEELFTRARFALGGSGPACGMGSAGLNWPLPRCRKTALDRVSRVIRCSV